MSYSEFHIGANTFGEYSFDTNFMPHVKDILELNKKNVYLTQEQMGFIADLMKVNNNDR